MILLERGDEFADADEDSKQAIDWGAAKKRRDPETNGTILKTEEPSSI